MGNIIELNLTIFFLRSISYDKEGNLIFLCVTETAPKILPLSAVDTEMNCVKPMLISFRELLFCFLLAEKR